MRIMEYGNIHVYESSSRQLIINEDYALKGVHMGTVKVESGTLTVHGEILGTLEIHGSAKAVILGKQSGTVILSGGAELIVSGRLLGTVIINSGGSAVVEEGGILAGTLINNGQIIIRGVFGGEKSGDGNLIIEASGKIVEPVIEDGKAYYPWHLYEEEL